MLPGWLSNRAVRHTSCVGLAFFAVDAVAANAPLIAHDDPVALPGIGRVVFGFLVTVALACAIVYALRRWLPRFAARTGSDVSRLSVQTSVRNGARFHIVTLDRQTILVVEGKNGTAMTILPAGPVDTSATPSS
jgi:hypothetical protein